MDFFEGFFTWLGRTALAAIFVLAAIHHYKEFDGETGFKQKIVDAGVVKLADKAYAHPQNPAIVAWAALGFMVVGGVLVALGYKARFGALLLLVFVGLATYFFHNPFAIVDEKDRINVTIQFLQHVAIAGGLCLILARGAGRWSMDAAAWDDEEF